MGPPGGAGATTFDRDMAQYIDGGSHTFDIATNGGFTIVALVMFTGSRRNDERIIDLKSDGDSNRVSLRRPSVNIIEIAITQTTSVGCLITTNSVIVQNFWQDYVVTYDGTNNILKLRVDNSVFTTTCPALLINRGFATTEVGRILTGRMAGLYIVDDLLPEHEISATLKKMHTGEDVLQPCTSCVPGTYGTGLGQTSISACVDCEQGKHNPFSGAVLAESCTTCPTMSSAPDRTTCQCNDGFSGNNAASCAMCAPGKYRGATSATNWARACGDMKTQACQTAQVSILNGLGSELAVDGLGWGGGRTFTDTFANLNPTWWSIDLGLEVSVRILRVVGRLDAGSVRMENYTIFIGNNNSADGRFVNNSICVEEQRALSNVAAQTITCNTQLSGRYVFFVLPRPEHLNLCEVEIFSSDCALCPANSMSMPGSALVENCKCDAGYTGPDGGPCTACETGTYKPDTGAAPCQSCPAGTFNSKHGGHAVTSCTRCRKGKYNPDEGSASESDCLQCPEGTYHRTRGVASVDECKECSCNAF